MFLVRNLGRNCAECSLKIAYNLHTERKFSSTVDSTLNASLLLSKKSKQLINEKLGQPTSWTHPHLLKTGEISPNIKLSEFVERRQNFVTSLQKYARRKLPEYKNHLIVIPSAVKKYMSDKIPYQFRQDSDFLYLTGCLEPDSILLLMIYENDDMKSILFMRTKDKRAELWDGSRTGSENAVTYFGVHEAYDVENFESILKSKKLLLTSKALLKVPVLWYDNSKSEQKQLYSLLGLSNSLMPLQSPTNIIHELRVIKSNTEIELMRKTCQIGSESINEVINETKVGDSEHYIQARMDYKCRMRDASYLAYPPVVASGQNATTIHYICNTQKINDYDLILMDAGCEYAGYTSDITRTWPANKLFTNAQRTLYDIIYKLQTELIAILDRKNVENLDQLFDMMCFKLGLYMQEAGLIPKHLSKIDVSRVGFSFCQHHVSHYLGMDVHDTPLVPRSIQLMPGMICTVEPGIYIPLDRLDIPKEFRGIGIRIEDDILITKYGVEVLTESCNKNFE